MSRILIIWRSRKKMDAIDNISDIIRYQKNIRLCPVPTSFYNIGKMLTILWKKCVSAERTITEKLLLCHFSNNCFRKKFLKSIISIWSFIAFYLNEYYAHIFHPYFKSTWNYRKKLNYYDKVIEKDKITKSNEQCNFLKMRVCAYSMSIEIHYRI